MVIFPHEEAVCLNSASIIFRKLTISLLLCEMKQIISKLTELVNKEKQDVFMTALKIAVMVMVTMDGVVIMTIIVNLVVMVIIVLWLLM